MWRRAIFEVLGLFIGQKCPFSSAKKWHFERPKQRTETKNLAKHPPKWWLSSPFSTTGCEQKAKQEKKKRIGTPYSAFTIINVISYFMAFLTFTFFMFDKKLSHLSFHTNHGPLFCTFFHVLICVVTIPSPLYEFRSKSPV